MSATNSDIAVVCCHFNPCGFDTPRKNLDAVKAHMKALGVPLIVEEFNPDAWPTEYILWQKEALLNLAISKLPKKITKVILLDADVLIPSAAWVEQVSALLDSVSIAQPWSRVIFLDEAGKEQRAMASVACGYANKDARACDFSRFHPGFCWAIRRDVSLPDTCPVGLGDAILAKQAISSRNLGCIKADIKTLWHGDLCNRGYATRKTIIEGFDPATDLEQRSAPGPLKWSDHALTHKRGMVRAVVEYFGGRLEDGPQHTEEETVPLETDPNWPTRENNGN